ncbi:hypothetical protein ABKV19_022721 [Rosa sericea]
MQKTKVSETAKANVLCFDVLNLFSLRPPPPSPHKAPKQTTSSPQRHPRLPPHRKHLHPFTGLVAILIYITGVSDLCQQPICEAEAVPSHSSNLEHYHPKHAMESRFWRRRN